MRLSFDNFLGLEDAVYSTWGRQSRVCPLVPAMPSRCTGPQPSTRWQTRSCHFSAFVIQRHPMSSLSLSCANAAFISPRYCSHHVHACPLVFADHLSHIRSRCKSNFPRLPTILDASRRSLNRLEHIPSEPSDGVILRSLGQRTLGHVRLCPRCLGLRVVSAPWLDYSSTQHQMRSRGHRGSINIWCLQMRQSVWPHERSSAVSPSTRWGLFANEVDWRCTRSSPPTCTTLSRITDPSWLAGQILSSDSSF